MQRDNLQGDRGRRSGTKGTLGRPPPIPLAVFPLHSLSPNLQPSPGHRYAISGKFVIHRTNYGFSDYETTPDLWGGATGAQCAPTEKCEKC